MTSALGGLDGLVFTAGIGEGSAFVREQVCGRLGFLGVELDLEENGRARAGRDDLGSWLTGPGPGRAGARGHRRRARGP